MMDPEVLEEFKIEADELLNESEEFLLAIENRENFEASFNGVFRAFHSLRGAAGMFEIDDLQAFMHKIETQFESLKSAGEASQNQVDYFLSAVDAARNMISGEQADFDTDAFEKLNKGSPEAIQEVATVEVAEKKEEVAKRSEMKSQKKKGLVYVVDDEEFIGKELGDILEGFGFQTKVYLNPEDTLRDTLEEEPDLICTDLKMPEMTGLELLEKVRAGKKQCPVVFITGYIDNDLLTNGLEHGASGFLEKPFEEHEVVSLASQAIERHKVKKLLNRSLSYILYQFNDLDKYLKEQGKEVQRQNLKTELENLLSLKKELS